MQILDDEEIKNALTNTPVQKVWGVGKRLNDHLNKAGINTALDLAKANPQNIRKKFDIDYIMILKNNFKNHGYHSSLIDDISTNLLNDITLKKLENKSQTAKGKSSISYAAMVPVSYTHLTLPTKA